MDESKFDLYGSLQCYHAKLLQVAVMKDYWEVIGKEK